MTAPPADQAARTTIESELERTLFVEAGAGSGKTTALVQRIVALILEGDVRLSQIAAITFTEAAASELRSRVRESLEVRERKLRSRLDADAELLARCRAAIDDADSAAISTLHSFAQRILSEHPVAVGLPPRVEVLDEVQSLLEFERRWSRFLDDLLERRDLVELLLRALLLDIKFNDRHRGLRSVAVVFNENWDRLEAMAGVEPELAPLRWAPLLDRVDPLLRLRDRCTAADDKLAVLLEEQIEPALRRLRDASDDDERLRLLTLWPARKASIGQKGNWDDVADARALINDFNNQVRHFLDDAADGVLRALAGEVARFTRAMADERRAEGRLEFHDLLVLARDLLRTDAEARRALHDRYRRLLLDEFQDTDPIQIELAALIASSSADEKPPTEWSEIDTDEGRLFFVGDPKQSIYRFRRASIETFVDARSAFGDDRPVSLTQNFRTVEPIVEFVNGLFGSLIQADEKAQPAYEPLTAHREAVQGIDQRPTVFGGPHPDDTKAHALRVAEAEDVAAAIAQIMDRRSRWLVHRGDERPSDHPEWDLPDLSDIVILIPTRTSLPVLGQALEANHIPYRADTGSLVFDSQEVRDIISALRAIDDPADEVSVVAALRSPLYGCGDDDLARWCRDGGHWDYRLDAPVAAPADDPVRAALDDLLERHRHRWWIGPSALIQSIVDERRSMLLAIDRPRPRDSWRRLRYLQDQARAFSEAGGGDLRAFLDWVALQGADGARTHEPILAEPDDDAVRIMTIHSSKGLEFPIVVVSGLTTVQGSATRERVFFDGDRAEISL
ncbi:MAG: UvrD-helicase domain-containing protein, partial [Acidimicrobiia bacterium]|nr:UvrD-helicase domain-containing protein [Acidimicrobiia bacterium]